MKFQNGTLTSPLPCLCYNLALRLDPFGTIWVAEQWYDCNLNILNILYFKFILKVINDYMSSTLALSERLGSSPNVSLDFRTRDPVSTPKGSKVYAIRGEPPWQLKGKVISLSSTEQYWKGILQQEYSQNRTQRLSRWQKSTAPGPVIHAYWLKDLAATTKHP